MSAKAEKLVRMANQIATFFRPYPEAEAVAGTREHIQAFWTPGMRHELLEHLRSGAAGVDPIVAEALAAMPAGRSPIAKETAGPETLGQMESDAG